MNRTRRILAGLVMGAALLTLPASPAQAAKPNNQACLGKDASAAAQTGLLGEFVSTTAKSAPGAIGEEVQLHLAGEIPDSVFPNTCND